MKVYGLIGYPLEHSFSPSYFQKKFEQENIEDCSYELFPLHHIDLFKPLLENKKNIVGLNVTIPYKEAILPYISELDVTANSIGAINCIKTNYTATGVYTKGYNTDMIGFKESIVPLLKPHHQKALVFGWGGSARAVKYVLELLGIKVVVVSRTQTKFGYQDIDEYVLDTYTILVNTTPVGMYPGIDAVLPIPFEYITEKHLCYDLIYNPEKTVFLEKAEAQGATLKNGLEMLTIQAEESWRIWNL